MAQQEAEEWNPGDSINSKLMWSYQLCQIKREVSRCRTYWMGHWRSHV